MRAVVFDIGGVLIQWDPHLAWIDEMGSREAVAEFLDRIDFSARNLRGDQGERFADLAAELDNEADRARLAAYVERYHLTVPAKMPGTWGILYRLKNRGVELHAITNVSAETWPAEVEKFPELGTIFGVAVVSGQERMLKPQPEIFATFCDRAGLKPKDCLFIDDRPDNVEAACAFGMDAVQFTNAQMLEHDLIARGLL
ncbi:HAD family hydrolase [Qingshengfaniella alkalisoli]|nr:HAD family phosphatase [Qingshengfaniella alkalisoli]